MLAPDVPPKLAANVWALCLEFEPDKRRRVLRHDGTINLNLMWNPMAYIVRYKYDGTFLDVISVVGMPLGL